MFLSLFLVVTLFSVQAEQTIPMDYYRAIYEGDLERVRHYLSEIDDPDQSCDSPYSLYFGNPLINAIYRGHRDIAELLWEKGARGYDGSTYALMNYACQYNHPDIVELLIERGADPDETKESGYTFLMRAVEAGFEDLTRLLIAEGADLTKENTKGSNLFHFAAKSQMFWLIDELIAQGVDINKINTPGYSPVQICVSAGNREMTEKLLREGAVLEYDDKTLLAACYGNYLDIVKICLEEKGYVAGWSHLRNATVSGSEDVTAYLIEEGYVDEEDTGGESLLHLATIGGNNYLVRRLAERGADLDSMDFENNGETPLQIAVFYGIDDTAKVLLDLGADPNLKDMRDDSPIDILFKLYSMTYSYSPEQYNWDLLAYLVERGGELYREGGYGFLASPPIAMALNLGDTDLIRYMLDHGADFSNRQTRYPGDSPLMDAVGGSDLALLEFLFDYYPVESNKEIYDTALMESCSLCDLAMTELLLKQGADPDGKGDYGDTSLHIASESGSLELVALLLRYGASREIANDNLEYPVDRASGDEIGEILQFSDEKTERIKTFFQFIEEGDVKAVINEINRGMNINIPGPEGDTPLICAMEQREYALVDFFLNQGADPNAPGEGGRRPLHLAAEQREIPLIDKLVSYGADPNRPDDIQQRPLHLAIETGALVTVQKLIEAGADPNLQDRDGSTALTKSLDYYSHPIAEYLLSLDNIDIQTPNALDFSPLIGSLMRGDKDLAEELIALGADITIMDREGGTALHYAVSGGYLDMVNEFLERGCDVNRSDKGSGRPTARWYTPLHYGAGKGNPEMISFLLQKGADPNAQASRFGNNYTPLHMAVEKEWEQTACLLLDAGADPFLEDWQGRTVLDICTEKGWSEMVELIEFKYPGGER
ncbi:MAG: ankyrin repeat domain-containing protein [Spirochaetales bacterium]|nr:ankyrin repeat domain-containing protein [Spirochaetales bacterium]